MEARAASSRWAVTTTSETDPGAAAGLAEGVISPRSTALADGAPGSTWARAAVVVRDSALAVTSRASLEIMRVLIAAGRGSYEITALRRRWPGT